MRPFIRQLVLKGFRSIPAARIEFDNPTILVGRNAWGVRFPAQSSCRFRRQD